MILNREVVPAPYTLLREFDGASAPEPGTAIPLAAWLALASRGEALTGVGVVLEGSDAIEPLRAHLGELAFAALHVPTFRDGRTYSHARRLRTFWNYAGPIVMFGDVQRDQLLYMSRCGANGFYMREGSDLRASLAAFSLYTHFYQYN
jgi:uncharacterized protein (DUF934 family)